MARMRVMAAAGRYITGCALIHHFLDHGEPRQAAAEKAVALIQWIFEGTLELECTRSFTLHQVKSLALGWLHDHENYRALVVQTLRVEAIVRFGMGDVGAAIPSELLVTFGSEFPTRPDPGSYSALLDRVIETLPPSARLSTRSWMSQHGLDTG